MLAIAPAHNRNSLSSRTSIKIKSHHLERRCSLRNAVWAATTTINLARSASRDTGFLQVAPTARSRTPPRPERSPLVPSTRDLAARSRRSAARFVVDRSDASNVCCKLISKNAGGTSVQSASVCSTGNTTAYQSLALPQITDPYSFSTFSVQCTVPAINGAARSRIQFYRTAQE